MKYYLFYLLVVLSTSSIAQGSKLESSIIKRNWQFDFINLKRIDTAGHEKGDTVLLYKTPKRLKLKKNRPVRFKKDGVVLMPQVPFGGCGTVGTFESLWYLKWKEYKVWQISQKENNTFLQLDNLSLKLINWEKKKYTFIVSDINENTSNIN